MKTTITIIFLALASVGFGQSFVKDYDFKGVNLRYWQTTRITEDLLADQTIVTLTPYFSRAAYLSDKNNGFQEFQKQVTVSGTWHTKRALRDSIAKPMPVMLPDSTFTESNFFANLPEE